MRETVIDNGKRLEAVVGDQAVTNDQAGDNNDWAKKDLHDDDTRSINSAEDERVRCPEFNEKTGMSKPQLCKGMKFPNGNVFRAALRKYVVQKTVDIKFKFNEKTKVSVHCKYECGWKVYTSQISRDLTFQIKTMVPT